MTDTSAGSGPTETILDPGRRVHLGIWRDEALEPYARHFTWTVPELTDAQRRAIAVGEVPAGPGATFLRVADLIEPGYLPVETGLSRGGDGALCVAVWTPFPGATPAMLDWWMGWHIARTDRYKLWHPQAHAFAQPRFDFSAVSDASDRERYVGNTSWVDEYIGPILVQLAITFLEPAAVGLGSEGRIGDVATDSTTVVGEVRDSNSGTVLSHLVHHVRSTVYGCEMRSRFYFPPGVPGAIGCAMLDHCATEMANLAGFLPQLFASVVGSGPLGPLSQTGSLGQRGSLGQTGSIGSSGA